VQVAHGSVLSCILYYSNIFRICEDLFCIVQYKYTKMVPFPMVVRIAMSIFGRYEIFLIFPDFTSIYICCNIPVLQL